MDSVVVSVTQADRDFLAGFDAATKLLDDSFALADHRWPEYRQKACENHRLASAAADAGGVVEGLRDAQSVFDGDDPGFEAIEAAIVLLTTAPAAADAGGVVYPEPHPQGFYTPPDSFYAAEVAAFEQAHPFISHEKARKSDGSPEEWGRVRYRHSHVDVTFMGWVEGRYSLTPRPAAPAPSTAQSNAVEQETLHVGGRRVAVGRAISEHAADVEQIKAARAWFDDNGYGRLPADVARSLLAALAPRDPAPEFFAESAKNPGDAGGEGVREAASDLIALANLIDRPPLDDVLLERAVALRSAKAIRIVLAALAMRPDALKQSPLIEALTPSNDEWLRCESIQDTYDLMKRRIDRAFSLAALQPAAPAERGASS